MREPPHHVTSAAVLDAVRAHWATDIDAIEHLPVGFGAHHWQVSSGGVPRFFVTLDGLGARHSGQSLEAAYASAADLAAGGLEFVVASVPTCEGVYTIPLADCRVSCVRWLECKAAGSGPIDDAHLATQNAEALARLHAAPVPAGIPSWCPRVGPDFADTISELAREPWQTGPFGEEARQALSRRIDAIHRWTDSYHELGRRALDRPWVPTHGEPHTANQVITSDGVMFVDWESLAKAPRERDLRSLVDAGYADFVTPDWDMIELFDLEWRLDELSEYSTWFSQPHTGTASDQVAINGLLEELERPDWTRPAG